jgi:hypothetical protein
MQIRKEQNLKITLDKILNQNEQEAAKQQYQAVNTSDADHSVGLIFEDVEDLRMSTKNQLKKSVKKTISQADLVL